MMTIQFTYKLMIVIVFIGIAQASIENILLSIKYPSFNRFVLKNSSFISKYERWLSFAFDLPGIWILLVLRLIIAITVVVLAVLDIIYPSLLLLYILIDLLGFRRWALLSVSDTPLQRVLIITTSIHLFFNDNQISILGFGFIYINLCLAYFAAGWHKLKSPPWRNGLSIKKFVMSFFYVKNEEFLYRNIKYWKLMGWLVILFELSFFLALFGKEMLLLFLVSGFLFHTFLIFVCGINFFFWTFIAAYPAVIFLNELLSNYW